MPSPGILSLNFHEEQKPEKVPYEENLVKLYQE